MKAVSKIKQVEVSKLKEADYNPRDIAPENLELLGQSIEKFGLVEPIIWNEHTGNVVGGHQRLKVLQENGVKKTNVVVVDLPLKEEKALNVALNSPRLQGFFTDGLNLVLDELEADLPELAGALKLDELRTYPKLETEEIESEEQPQIDEFKDGTTTCPACGHVFKK
jgi:ParB-like chromosome segregation protein Spo0J